MESALHTVLLVPPMQLLQEEPSSPHIVGDVPGWHVVPALQQPWLHTEYPVPQFAEHVWRVSLQALSVSQSVCELQPHVPPARHAEPLGGHETHVPPGGPQASGLSGELRHVVPLQQVPLHGDELLQVVVHTPPVLQA